MIESALISETANNLITLFRQHVNDIGLHSGQVLNQVREQALHQFKHLGLPSPKTETYRYTPIENYFRGHFSHDFAANPLQISVSSIFHCEIPDLDTHVVLVLNGFFHSFKPASSLPEGVIVSSLAEAALKHTEIVKDHYARYAPVDTDGLVALNTMFAQDGVFVYIPSHTLLDKPLQIINLCYSTNDLHITRRNLIVAEEGSSASIVVCDHTLCARSYLTHSLTEIFVGKDALLSLDRLQNENNLSAHINHVYVHQKQSSRFSGTSISLHGGLIRNNLLVRQEDTDCESRLNGLFLGSDRQHVANYVLVDHAGARGTSNQLFKGILDEHATGAFNGKILVRSQAQKIQAFQKNSNILLSDTARMHTKPHLEIYADDVKCSHGATVGQLDPEAMFYLRSRGIGQNEARHLLMYAFANDIVGQISLPLLNQRLIDLVDKRLRGDLSKCSDCDIHCG